MGGPRCHLAIDETVILLHPPLPLVGVSIVMERERQQNNSLVNGYSEVPGLRVAARVVDTIERRFEAALRPAWADDARWAARAGTGEQCESDMGGLCGLVLAPCAESPVRW